VHIFYTVVPVQKKAESAPSLIFLLFSLGGPVLS
jgi:hypothetical protein